MAKNAPAKSTTPPLIEPAILPDVATEPHPTAPIVELPLPLDPHGKGRPATEDSTPSTNSPGSKSEAQEKEEGNQP